MFFTSDPGSSVPAEIRARGPRAEHAFQMAMQNGKVKVYRGRIMLLGQDRAGKTSLRKSLLGLPFDPEQESTVGVEVDEVENRPFAASDHVVQNPPCWRASSLLFPHWDIKTKASQASLVQVSLF